MNLEKGTRIYYGGDMANDPGHGIITARFDDRWGRFVDIKLDDGRIINSLSISAFSDIYKGHGGTRFVTEKAYGDWKKKLIKSLGA